MPSYEDFLQVYLNSLDLILNPPPIQDITRWDQFQQTLSEHLGELRNRVQAYVDSAVDMILDVPAEAGANDRNGTGGNESARGAETRPAQDSNTDGNRASSSNGSGETETSRETNEGNHQAAGGSQRAASLGSEEPFDKKEEEITEESSEDDEYDRGYRDGFLAGIQFTEGSLTDMNTEDNEEEEEIFQIPQHTSEQDSSTNETNEEASVVEREEPLQPKPSKIPRLQEGPVSRPVSSDEISTLPTITQEIQLTINGHRIFLANYGKFIMQGNRVLISLPLSPDGDNNMNRKIRSNKGRDENTGEIYWGVQLDDTVVRIWPQEGAELEGFKVNFVMQGLLQIEVP